MHCAMWQWCQCQQLLSSQLHSMSWQGQHQCSQYCLLIGQLKIILCFDLSIFKGSSNLPHIVTSNIEHPAISAPLARLEQVSSDWSISIILASDWSIDVNTGFWLVNIYAGGTVSCDQGGCGAWHGEVDCGQCPGQCQPRHSHGEHDAGQQWDWHHPTCQGTVLSTEEQPSHHSLSLHTSFWCFSGCWQGKYSSLIGQ